MKDMRPLAKKAPQLIAWWRASERPLPWEKSIDPYLVWISEVMSQQSVMAAVMPYFHRWKKQFPHVHALAEAPEETVLAAWAGLGYYSRARNVHKAAKALSARLRETKKWPRTKAEWRELPGVGDYTAAAVAAIAFDAPEVPVDGNVVRVLARFAGVPDPLNKRADRKTIDELAAKAATLVPEGQHSAFAQSLVALGARICRPGAQAQCEVCPLARDCEARQQNKVSEWPRRKERRAFEKVAQVALLYRSPTRALLLRKIPHGKRLAGQWELPLFDLPEEDLVPKLAQKFEVRGPVSHGITHHQYRVFSLEAGQWDEELPEGHAFWEEGSKTPGVLTTLTQKLLLEKAGP